MIAVSKALFVDGHSLAYRAFFALPDTLATAEGQPTNAVLGFAQMLLRFLDEEKPEYVAVAFDKGKPAFRLDQFTEYKAQRKPTPNKLRSQLPLIKEFLDALGATVIEVEGYEGDDILGALTERARAAGVEVLLLTGDRDTLQLVGPGVKAAITLRGISETTVFDAEAVRKRYGVEPAKLPDLKGLLGDVSDNIPGVPGIGEKTAPNLLDRFGGLDELLAHLDEVTPERVRETLKSFADEARMSRDLATIRRDVPFEAEPKLETLRYRGFNADKLAAFLRRLEFRSLLRRLGLAEKAAGATPIAATGTVSGPGPGYGAGLFAEGVRGGPAGELPGRSPGAGAGGAATLMTSARTTLVRGRKIARTRAELATAAGDLARASRLALAARLEGDRPLGARLIGLALAADGRPETVYVPVDAAGRTPPAGQTPKTDQEAPSGASLFAGPPASSADGVAVQSAAEQSRGLGLGLPDLLELLGPVLASPEPAKVMHGAKPFRVWLAAAGGDLHGLALDTELGAYLLDPSRSNYSLEALAREFARQDILLPDAPPEGWSPRVEGLDWPAERLCLQADIVLAVADPIRAELADKDLDDLLDSIEMPLEEVLAAMELAGIGVDGQALREMSTELGRRIGDLAREIYDLAGQEFNINSPRQLGDILFGKLKLPTGRKTATGAYSTSAEVLEELAVSHEIVAKILDYRQLTKLKGTYTDGMAPLVSPATGRLHTVFKQTATATGRLSSAEPNLQNIPIREEEGRRIRRVFVPAPGHVFLAGDYSQIELRVMAHLSGDPALIEAFRRGEDIHQRTASEIFRVPMHEVTPELRFRAKAVNFGIIYGITDYGLSRGVKVGREEAAAYIEQYLSRYAGVRAFVDKTLAEARSHGYVSTLFHRRRYLPELESANRVRRQFAERAARNTPIQGTAADIIKMAMVRIHREMLERRMTSRMLLQVHDELLFEVPEAEVEPMAELVRARMEGVVSLDVPLKVDLKVGPNWYDMRKLG